MKLAVCSLAHGEKYENISKFTFPLFREYAARIGADFKEIKWDNKQELVYSPAWLKLILLYGLLKTYDRVIFLDADIVIHPELESLFDIVPETHFGAYQEGDYIDRSYAMMKAIEDHKLKPKREYEGQYFNSGVMVLSKIHRDLFVWPEQVVDNFYEQSLINARVFCSGVPVHRLHYHYNRMSSHDLITGEDVFAAKIVHFAGAPSNVDIVATMKNVYEKWISKEKPRKRIHISCGGGIGDVILSEPIIRYALEKVWPESEFPEHEFTLSCAPHCQRIFDHLKHWKRLTIIDSLEKLNKSVPYLTLETHPKRTAILPLCFYMSMHNQDWASYNSVRAYLSADEKRIRLAVHPENNLEVESAVREGNVFRGSHEECRKISETASIAVHCGIGWPSKTFGPEYWQKIVDALDVAGFQVVLYGQRVEEFVNPDGTTDRVSKGIEEGVKCPANGIDLRGRLSIGGTMALISKCRASLTNDSMPTHIAGAFDNLFFLIASCKHPELVMPFRNGSQSWRARAFYKEITLTSKQMKPDTLTAKSIADVEGNILDYLPSVEEVVDGIAYGMGRFQ